MTILTPASTLWQTDAAFLTQVLPQPIITVKLVANPVKLSKTPSSIRTTRLSSTSIPKKCCWITDTVGMISPALKNEE
jgi:hypothetical protein